MAVGLGRINNNTRLYRDLLLRVKSDYPDAAKDIRRLKEKGAQDEAQRLAHSIKGVAGNLGAKPLQAAAQELESLLKKGEPIDEILETFDSEMTVVQEGLKQIKEDEPVGATGSQDESSPQELKSALEDLIPVLKKRRAKQVKEHIAGLTTLGWPPPLAQKVSKLTKLAKRYKYKDMLPLAEEILAELES